jgi:hypothetical protein
MPNLTHSLDPSSVAAVTPPGHHEEHPNRLSQVCAVLLAPFIAIGYHVAVTVLKLFGHRHE